jgi:hypothetical protein
LMAISEIRFHGSPQDVPAAFRESPPATVEAAKLKRDQVTAQKAELDARLAPMLDRIQAGTATPEEMSAVTELAEDSRILADRLHQAQVQLTVAEEKAGRERSATARARFNFLLAENRQKRAKFARLYKEVCVTLGELCAATDEASRIANSFVNVAGMNPVDRNSVAEMSERVDPLPALLDAGLSPTTGFGWDFRINVVPLKKG